MKYVAFFRGINVGGHHKVPMSRLKQLLVESGYKHPISILNSGNIIFENRKKSTSEMEDQLEVLLKNEFGFEVPTIVKNAESLKDLYTTSPFNDVGSKELKHFITFLKNPKSKIPDLPIYSEDGFFKIIAIQDNVVLSMLDLSNSKTVKAMKVLEDHFGKDITTRNWNTLSRLIVKLE